MEFSGTNLYLLYSPSDSFCNFYSETVLNGSFMVVLVYVSVSIYIKCHAIDPAGKEKTENDKEIALLISIMFCVI